MDKLLADTSAQILDVPLRAALEQVLGSQLNQLQAAMETAYAGGGNVLSAVPGNAAVQNASNQLASIASTGGNLRNALTSASGNAASLVNEIARQLDTVDKGLAELEKLCGDPGGAGAADPASEFLYKITREIVKEVFGEDFVGSGNALIRNNLHSLLGSLLEEAGPALTQVTGAIRKARSVIAELRSGTGAAAAATARFTAQINTALSNEAAMAALVSSGVQSFLLETGASRDAAKQFFAENSPAALRERLLQRIIAAFHASPLGTGLRKAVAEILDPVRTAFNQALDLALAEINHMVNEVVLRITGELKNMIFNPVVDEITSGVQGLFKEKKQAGDMPNEYGRSSDATKVMAMAKIQGYARTKGDSLDFLRVDAEIALKMPDGFDFKGYYQIKNVDSNTPGVSCRGGGSVQTEICMGATAGVSMQIANGTLAYGQPLAISIKNAAAATAGVFAPQGTSELAAEPALVKVHLSRAAALGADAAALAADVNAYYDVVRNSHSALRIG